MSTLTSLADWWASLAWAVTWQLAALGLLAWLAERLLRLRQPRARHALWWFVLLAPLALAPGRLALERREAVVKVTPPALAARVVAEMPRFAMTALPPTREVRAAPALAEEPAAPSGLKVRTVDALALAWFMGCALLTLRLVMGHRRVRRMLAESRPVEEASALEALRALCAEAGVRREVEVRSSGSVGAPVLYGLRRPVIVVPEEWVGSLAPDEFRALLAHEVAHLRRRDVLANLAQRLIEIPLFFHPLAWVASRRITQAREELCDAWALGQGADPAGYARWLTAAAERAYANGGAAALGVAERRFTLLRRVEAIMEVGNMKRMSRVVAIGLVTILLAAAGAFAAVSLAGREADSQGLVALAAEASSEAVTGAGAGAAAETVSFSGRVLDERGRPVAGASIWICVYQYADSPFLSQEIGRTGSDGRLSAELNRKANIPYSTWREPWACWIAAHKSGHGVGWTRRMGADRLEEATITLGPSRTLRGKVMDADGQLLPKVSVSIGRIMLASKVTGPAALVRVRHDPFSPGGPEEAELTSMDRLILYWSPIPKWARTRTDAQGEFVLADLPADAIVNLCISTCGSGESHREDQSAPDLGAITLSEHKGELIVRLVRGPIIEGDVRLAGPHGKPAARVAVGAMGVRPDRPYSHYALDTVTDDSGHYRFDRLLPATAQYTVAVWDEQGTGFAPKPITLGPGERAEAPVIVLAANGWIEGRVLDADTNEPIEGLRVVAFSPRGYPRDAPRAVNWDDPMGRTEADGGFRLWSAPGEVPINVQRGNKHAWSYKAEHVVSGGRAMVRVARDENKPSERVVQVKSSETTTDVVLCLRRAAEVSGVVVGPDGKPWGEGYVDVSLDRTSVLGNVSAGGTGLVRPDGTFRVTQLMPDVPVRLSLFDDGRKMGGTVAVSPVRDDVKQVKIEMRPAVRVTGRVLLPDGKPAAGAEIWCRGIANPRARCDAHGRFEARCGIPGLSSVIKANLPPLSERRDERLPPDFTGVSETFEPQPAQQVIDVGDILMEPWKPRSAQ